MQWPWGARVGGVEAWSLECNSMGPMCPYRYRIYIGPNVPISSYRHSTLRPKYILYGDMDP